MSALIAATLFVTFASSDVLYVLYFAAVDRRHPLRATTYSVAIHLISIFGVVEYIGNHWYIIPAIAGASIGTYGAVRWGSPKPKEAT